MLYTAHLNVMKIYNSLLIVFFVLTGTSIAAIHPDEFFNDTEYTEKSKEGSSVLNYETPKILASPSVNTVPSVTLSASINKTMKISQGISVADVDGDPLTVTLSVDTGADIFLGLTTNLTVNDNDGTDGSVQISGAIADLNLALQDISIIAPISGTAQFTIVSNDGTSGDVIDNFSIEVASRDNGLAFDGNNDRITVSTGESVVAATFTFEAWVLIREDGSAFYNIFLMSTPTANFIRVTNTGQVIASSGTGLEIISNAGTFPLDGNWHHLAFVDEGPNEFIYVDGVSVGIASDAFTAFNSSSSSTLIIGSSVINEGLNGIIDEIRIWSVGRTSGLISEHYNLGVAGNETGLEIYYRLDQGLHNGDNTGLNAATNDDDSGATYQGTLANFTLSSGTTSNWVYGQNYYPAVTTDNASSITSSSVLFGGNVTNAGGGSIVERGTVYALTSTNANPIIGGTGVTKNDEGGTTTGAYSEVTTGLILNSNYSFKAYVINDGGTSYGSLKSFSTLNQTTPTVTTTNASKLTSNTATVGGNITLDGGASITARGVVYALTATNANPEIGGPGVTVVTEGGVAVSAYTQALSSLTAGGAYSYKAYATNSEGTSYGIAKTFTLAPTPVLVAGQIAMTMYNSDLNGGDQIFSFLALDDIPSGTKIHFTDNGWDEDTQDLLGTTEGFLTYTTGSTIGVGSQVLINAGPSSPLSATIFGGAANGAVTETGTFDLTVNGDNILVFDGRVDGPADYAIGAFVTGILADLSSANMNTGTNEWTTVATTESESEIPSNLTNGTDAISLFPISGETDNAVYNFSVKTGLPAAIRTAINTRTNWSTNDATAYTSGNIQTITPDVPPKITNVAWLDANPQDGDIDQVQITFHISVNFTDTDGAGGTGLDVFSGINFSTIPDYGDGSYDNITVAVLDLATPITGTAFPANTLTYSQAATNATIVSASAGIETKDGEVFADHGGTYADGAAPYIISTITIDDGDGTLDALELEFSENITDAGVTASDFGLNTGSGFDPFTSVNTAVSVLSGGADADADDQFITLVINSFTNVSGTGSAQYNYTSTTPINDAASNGMENFAASAVVDGAAPILISSTPADAAVDIAIENNIELNFSENIQVGTGNLTIVDVTAGTDTRVIAVGDGQVSVTGNQLIINPTANLISDNDYAIQVDASAVDDLAASANSYSGINDNTTINFTTIANAPTITQATWLDNNLDGDIDRLQLDFSEAVIIADIDGSGFDAIAISGGVITIDELDYSNNSGTATSLTLNVSNATGTGNPAVTISYNTASTSSIISNSNAIEVPNAYNPDAIVDSALPIVMQTLTVDDGDGTVDAMEVRFSEIMADASLSGVFADWTLDDGSGAASFTGFSSSVSNLASDTDANDEYVTFTISSGVSGTGTMDFAYSNTGSNITDGSAQANVLADIGTTTASDGAAPRLVQAITIDVNTDGNVDAMEIEFSEPMNDGSFSGNLGDWTLNDGVATPFNGSFNTQTTIVSGGTVNASNDQYVTLNITSGITGTAAMAYTYTGSNITDNSAQSVALTNITSTTAVDGAVPVIESHTLAASNTYVDIVFSEGIYTDDGLNPSVKTDWTFTFNQNGGTATNAVLDALTNTSDGALVGGESTIRFNIIWTGNQQGGSTENIEIEPVDGGSVADISPVINFMPGTETTGVIFANTVIAVKFDISSAANADNSAINLVFTEGVGRSTGGTSALRYNSTCNSGGGVNELCATFDDPDGLVTVSNFAVTHTGGSATLTFTFDIDTGTPDGNETFTFAPADGNEIKGVASGDMQANEQIAVNLTDQLPPTFTSATYFDLDENGSIDEVVFVMSEPISDASITASHFTLGGVAATGIETGGAIGNGLDPGTVDDNTFTLLFNVQGTGGFTVAFTGPSLNDIAGNDAAANASITATDSAAPVILSATTNDGNANGQIDQIVVVFSEDIDNGTLNGDGSDFTLSSPVYPVIAASFNSPNGATLTLTPSGSTDVNATPIVTLANGGIADADANTTTLGGFSVTSTDGADPYFASVTAASDADPTGFINGELLTINVDMEENNLNMKVNLNTLAAALPAAAGMTDSGDGTYSYSVFISSAMIAGDRTLAVTATDAAGNSLLNNSLIVNLDFTAPSVTITPTFTNVLSPALSGTVNDNDAVIGLTINSVSYVPTNNMDGTWSLAAGTISPDLTDNTKYSVIVTATDLAGNVGTDPTNGEVKIDNTAPTITSILRSNPLVSTTSASTVVFRVTFDEGVQGVDAGDFDISAFTASNSADAPIVSHISGGKVYDVTIDNISGSGTLALDVSSATIIDSLSVSPNAFAGTVGLAQSYEIDQTAPTVLSIVRKDSNPTSASTINFRATFSEPVTGVTTDGSDFSVNTSGPTIGTVTVTTISSSIYDIAVAVSGASGDVFIEANGAQDVLDLYGNGWDDTTVPSETYNVDFTAPTADVLTATVTGLTTTLTANLDEVGTVYYGVYTNGVVPANAAAVKAGTGALQTGSFSISNTTSDFIANFDLLASKTDYDLYVALEDAASPTANIALQTKIDILSGGVSVNPGTLPSDLCLEGPSKTLSDITITEGIVNDFRAGAGLRLRLNLPSGFEYDQTATVSQTGALNDVSAVSFDYPAPNVLRVTYTASTITGLDELIISGAKVKAVGSTAYAGPIDIERGGGTAVIFGAEGSDNISFGSVSSVERPSSPDILLGGNSVTSFRIAPSATFSLSGSNGAVGGTYTWYDDLGNFITGNSVTQANLNTLAGFDNSMADVYTMFLSTVDASGCESDLTEFLIGVLNLVNSEGTTNFSEGSAATTLTASEPTGWSGTFTGPGLGPVTNGAGSTRQVQFDPASATAVGSPHTISYILTNDSDPSKVFQLDQIFTVSSSTSSFLVQAGTTTSADLNYCNNGSTIQFDISSTALTTILSGGYRFTRLAGVGISQPVGYQTEDGVPANDDVADAHATATNWIFDPTAVGAITAETTVIIRMFGVPDGGKTVLAGGIESLIGAVEFTLFPEPSAQITNISNFYCEDDELFTIQARTNDVVNGTLAGDITTGYRLYKDNGGFALYKNFTGVTNDFDPSDPDQDGDKVEDETGTYYIEWTTEELMDGLCTTTVNSSQFQIRAKETAPVLDLTTGLADYGGFDGSAYVFEFCSGTLVPDFKVNTTTSTSDTRLTTANNAFDWYQGSSSIVDGDNDFSTFNAKNLFGGTNTPTGNIETDFYVTRTVSGCESDSVMITVRVYQEQSKPQIDATDVSIYANGSDYIFEYCGTAGASISYADLDIISNLDDPSSRAYVEDRSYFRVYDNAFSEIDKIDIGESFTILLDGGIVNAPNVASATASGTITTIFYISKVVADSSFLDGSAPFQGCESALTKITANVNTYPNALGVFDMQNAYDNSGEATFYLCSGDDLINLQTPGTANTLYKWYPDDGSGTAPNYAAEITVDGNNGRLATQANLEAANSDDFDVSGVYEFWVTQTTDYNLTTAFEGCESAPLKVVVQSFEDPAVITFDDAGGAQDYEVSYCEGDLASVSFPVTGSANSKFLYYVSNPSMTIASAATTLFAGSLDADGLVDISTSDLLLQNATQTGGFNDGDPSSGIYYFLISQVNDIDPDGALNNTGSVYEGCESELADMAYLKVNIYNVPSAPVTALNFESQRPKLFSEDSVWADGITVEGEGNVGEIFNWYEDLDEDNSPDGAAIFQGATASASDLNLAGTTGNGRYKFLVTQTQDIDAGVVGFEGCESAFLSLYVFEVPPVPSVSDPTPQCDVSVKATSTVIEYSGIAKVYGISSFRWYAYDTDLSPESENNVNNPDQTNNFTIASVEDLVNSGFIGDTALYVSQVINKDVNISGEIFPGTESEKSEVIVTIYPQPSQPDVTGNDISIDEYYYCEQLADPASEIIDILNPDPAARYVWYFDSSIKIPIDTATSITLAQINEKSIEGGYFDLAEDIDFEEIYAIYVTEVNSIIGGFEGCASEPTQVLIYKEPKALDFLFSDIDEDEEIVDLEGFCYDHGDIHLGTEILIDGESILASDGTYSINTGGLVDNGDGTATLNTADMAIAAGADREGVSTSHIISYTYTSEWGCEETFSRNIVINTQPTLDIAYFSSTGSNDASTSIDLTSVCYDQGTFLIRGIAESINADGGVFKLFYGASEFPNGGAFLDNGNGTARIIPDEIMSSDIVQETSEGNPQDFIVEFTFSDDNNCENTVQKMFTIEPIPTLDVQYDQPVIGFSAAGDVLDGSIVCYNEGTITIKGLASHIVGGEEAITKSGKADSIQFTINTGGLVDNGNGTATISLVTAALSKNSAQGTLTGLPTDHIVTLFYTDNNGCDNSVDHTFTINPLPRLAITIPDVTPCFDADPMVLIGREESGSSTNLSDATSGSFGIYIDDTAVTPLVTTGFVDNGDGTAIFNSDAIATDFFSALTYDEARIGDPSTYYIKFDYTDPTTMCSNSVIQSITIQPQPELRIEYNASTGDNVSGDLLDGSVICYDQSQFTIQGKQEGLNAVSGSFALYNGSFNPVSQGFNGAANNGTATLRAADVMGDPAVAGTREGLPVSLNLVFTYTDGSGCLNRDTANFTINPQPILDIVMPTAVCYDEPAFTVTSTHISGSGVAPVTTTTGSYIIATDPAFANTFTTGFTTGTNGTATFDPSTILGSDSTGTPKTYYIRFSYTDDISEGATCENFVDEQIIINPLPSLQIHENVLNSIIDQVCFDDPVVTFVGKENSGNQPNGIFTNATSGVFGLYTDPGATLDANNASSGFVDNANGTFSFDPALVGADNGQTQTGDNLTLYMKFSYSDGQSTMCDNNVIQPITILAQPDISFRMDNRDGSVILLGSSLAEDNYYLPVNNDVIRMQGWSLDKNDIETRGTFSLNATGAVADAMGTTNSQGQANFTASVAKTNRYSAAETFEVIYNTDGEFTDYVGDKGNCEREVSKYITILPIPEFLDYDAGQGVARNVRSIQACKTQDIEMEVTIENLAALGVTIDDIEFIWIATRSTGQIDTLTSEFATYVTVEPTGVNTSHIVFRNAISEIENDPLNVGYPNLSGNVGIKVLAIYNSGVSLGNVDCSELSASTTINIGDTPQPKIRWENTTISNNVADSTRFILSDASSLDIQINDISFTVKDEQKNVLATLFRSVESAEFSPQNIKQDWMYKFTDPGTYEVTFVYNSTSSCQATTVRYVTINETIFIAKGESEIHFFDTGSDGWYVNDVDYNSSKPGFDTIDIRTDQSWELGVTSDFGNLNTSSQYWVTNADGAYMINEQSWVYSPTYNFSALALPTVSFNYASYLEPKDGVALQYSLDDGITWSVLGSFDLVEGTSGKNWYNDLGINGDPGNFDDGFNPLNKEQFINASSFNPDGFGWGFAGGQDDDPTIRWRVAAHKLDIIPQSDRDKVRFRFALGASSGTKEDNQNRPYYGFAFDDFKIYDREKFIVLEQFSSLENANSLRADTTIYGLLERELSGDALLINYYTSLVENPDALNLRNSKDPGARATYYGLSTVPKSVISGVVQQADPTSVGFDLTVMGWNKNKFNELALDEAGFDIGDILLSGSSQEVIINTTFTSRLDLPAGTELSFRYAIVEKEISGQDVNTQYNVPVIYNALRKMLPSAAGFTHVGAVINGQPDFNIDFTAKWNINNVYDPNQLKVIVFVQLDNDVNPEAGLSKGTILQAKQIDVGSGKIIPDASNITATVPFGKEFSIYPNPSNRMFEVELAQPSIEEMNWVLYDQSGREVAKGILPKGSSKRAVSSEDLPGGIYMLHLYNDTVKWQPKRVIVVH